MGAYVLAAAIVFTSVVPSWLLFPLMQTWFGFSFFIKSYVYHTYPALKAKYDSSFNFWCGLPDKKTVDYTVQSPSAGADGAAARSGGVGGGGSSRTEGNAKVSQP